MDLSRFDLVDWDDEEDEDGNLAHCRQPDHLGGEAERVVYEVLSEQPVEVKFRVQTADFAIVGPDRRRETLWLVLLDVSYKRGDWLRPITGWEAEPAERAQWHQRHGKLSR